MAKKTKSRRGSAIKVDLSGVESRVLVKEGEYAVKVAEVTKEKGDKADYLKWRFEIDGGKFDGSSLYHNTSLSEKSLWNLKSLLEALQVDIPDEAFEIDPEEMVGASMMVTVEHDTWEGKKQAKIVDFWSGEGSSEDDDDEDDKKSKKGSKKKGKSEKPDEDAVNDMDEEELADVVKEFKLDIDLDDYPKIKKARAAVIEALEGSSEDDDDEDDKKSKKGSKKKGKKDAVDQDAINEMDEDELEAFVEEHDLDVKLSKYKSLRKKQAAVIDAGTEAGIVED